MSTARGELYAPIEPFFTGTIDTDDGHHVYYELVGNPDGRPAIYLHGGPGSGCSVNQRRMFDPERYCAVLMDQRGSGRSTPLAEESLELLDTNTTDGLISDIEAIRVRHGWDQWQTVLGLSWGTTLAVAYGEAHRDRVASMVLGLVTTTSRAEVEWITDGVKRIFPNEWRRFFDAVPDQFRRERVVDSYAAMLRSDDAGVIEHAAREWCAWEDAHVSLAPGAKPSPRYEDPAFRVRFARLVTHYWSHHAFRGDSELIDHADVLNGIPGVLINGRFDVSGPLITTVELAERWRDARTVVIDDSGHGTGDSFGPVIYGALDEFARL